MIPRQIKDPDTFLAFWNAHCAGSIFGVAVLPEKLIPSSKVAHTPLLWLRGGNSQFMIVIFLEYKQYSLESHTVILRTKKKSKLLFKPDAEFILPKDALQKIFDANGAGTSLIRKQVHFLQSHAKQIIEKATSLSNACLFKFRTGGSRNAIATTNSVKTIAGGLPCSGKCNRSKH